MVKTIILRQDGEIDMVKIPYNTDLDNFTFVREFNSKGEGNPKLLQEWMLFDNVILIYGWDKVKIGFENKHSMPSPIENSSFYNDIIVIKLNQDKHIENLSLSEYNHFKSIILDGFNDLEDDCGISDEFEIPERPPSIRNARRCPGMDWGE